MQVTLLDEQGVKLTDATSHIGRSAGTMLVDWVTRPDALFQYYFGGRCTVSVVSQDAQYSAVLGTRWQMGARFWFLSAFQQVPTVRLGASTQLGQDAGLVAATLHATPISADLVTPAAAALTRE